MPEGFRGDKMALAPETQAWLDDLKKEGSLSDEAYNSLKATFEGNSKADGFVKGSVLRQADYSRQSAEIQKAQKAVEDATKALADKEVAVGKFQTDLAQWKEGAQTNFDKAIKDREAAANKANAAVARLKSLAVAHGLDETEVLKDIDVITVPDKKNDQTDTTGFLRKEDLEKVLGKGIAESALVDASIHDVAQEYLELTGKPLRGAAELVTEAIKANKPISVYAAEKFGFEKLRKDREEAAYQERLKKDVDTAVAARLSEAGLPGHVGPGRTDLKGSPVLRPGGMPKPPEQEGNGVSAAVAAFQGGKYATNR